MSRLPQPNQTLPVAVVNIKDPKFLFLPQSIASLAFLSLMKPTITPFTYLHYAHTNTLHFQRLVYRDLRPICRPVNSYHGLSMVPIFCDSFSLPTSTVQVAVKGDCTIPVDNGAFWENKNDDS